MTDFAMACGAELSQANTTMWNNRYSSVTMNRSLMSQLYLEHGVIQVLIDQPVDDAFRGGIQIKCPELSADDLKELHMELAGLDILTTYAQALKWMRLFGGAGIIINADQDTAKPLNLKAITPDTPLEFYAADRWELNYSPEGSAALDQFKTNRGDRPFNYYGHVLHKSNVIKLNGKIAPSLIRGQFGGWGVSEIERILRSWNQYVKHQDVSFELLDEAKVDVFKIQGFNSAVASKNGAELTAKRISIAAQVKNYQNALVVDKEDDYEQKQIQYGGLADILKEIRIQLACDVRMPMTKLFGISAAGFNSGEDDIENYNAMIESEIRGKCKAGLILMLKVLCQKMFQHIPDSLDFDFKPLRMMTSAEESSLKDARLARTIQAQQAGLMTVEKAVEQLNSEQVFPVELSPDEAFEDQPEDDTQDGQDFAAQS
jgi:phage-related protein (TIGR01555 family)